MSLVVDSSVWSLAFRSDSDGRALGGGVAQGFPRSLRDST